MIDRFSKAKHWQLFILMYGLPFILQTFMFSSMVSQFEVNENQDPTLMLNYFKLFPILMFIYLGLFFGWFWSITNGLQKYISIEHRLKLQKIKIFFFIPLIYIFFFVMLIGSMLYGFSSRDNAAGEMIGKLFFLIIPLHLFSMFCIFYLVYSTSKTIKTAELQREVSFSDFIGECFMIWFFPVGIWFIQPRINRIVNETITYDDKVKQS